MGEDMNNRVNVLDVGVDDCSAKEALKKAIEFLMEGPVSIVEIVTAADLMLLDNQPLMKEAMRDFDMILAGDTAILETNTEFHATSGYDVKKYTFLKLLLHYMHKNRKRVYLLVGDQGADRDILEFLDFHYKGIEIVGMAKLVSEDRSDDMIVNAINGVDADCVISVLEVPLQEDFIMKNKDRLNANLWIGIGKSILPYVKTLPMREKILKYIIQLIFRKKVKEEK